jgi:hypothetical protein
MHVSWGVCIVVTPHIRKARYSYEHARTHPPLILHVLPSGGGANSGGGNSGAMSALQMLLHTHREHQGWWHVMRDRNPAPSIPPQLHVHCSRSSLVCVLIQQLVCHLPVRRSALLPDTWRGVLRAVLELLRPLPCAVVRDITSLPLES